MSIASRPFTKRLSSSSASTSWSVGTTPCSVRSWKNASIVCFASMVSSVNRVGLSVSSTISPPFDQTNGATLMMEGSIPSP